MTLVFEPLLCFQYKLSILLVKRVQLKLFSKKLTIVGDIESIRMTRSCKFSMKFSMEFSSQSMAISIRHSRQRMAFRCTLFFKTDLNPVSPFQRFSGHLPILDLSQSLLKKLLFLLVSSKILSNSSCLFLDDLLSFLCKKSDVGRFCMRYRLRSILFSHSSPLLSSSGRNSLSYNYAKIYSQTLISSQKIEKIVCPSYVLNIVSMAIVSILFRFSTALAIFDNYPKSISQKVRQSIPEILKWGS